MSKMAIQISHIRSKGSPLDSLKIRMRIFGLHILTALIEGLFLALWIVFHCGLDHLVIKRFGLSGINRWVLFCFQIVFAIYTLIPVVLLISEDIIIMVIRTQRRVRQELKGGKS